MIATGRLLCLAAGGMVMLGACGTPVGRTAASATSASPQSARPDERVVGPLTPADAQALATMTERLDAYIELHTRLERQLPDLPDEATPEQIDRNQRLFERRIRQARSGARPGDIFTPEAQPVIKRLLARIFGGREGRRLKASIMDENPVGSPSVKLTVNARYPDAVPLTTVPPQVLQVLPKLTEDLEYRFIGRSLILLDVHAHVVADFIEGALPE